MRISKVVSHTKRHSPMLTHAVLSLNCGHTKEVCIGNITDSMRCKKRRKVPCRIRCEECEKSDIAIYERDLAATREARNGAKP